MKIQNFTYLTFVLFLCLSCKKEIKSEVNQLCENEQFLLAPPMIKDREGIILNKDLDLNLNTWVHIKTLQDSLKTDDLCYLPILINHNINNHKVQLSISAKCGIISRFSYENIQLSFENRLLYRNDEVELKSLKNIIQKEYPYAHNTLNKIKIKWEYGLEKPIIDEVISSIANGYLDKLKAISKKEYSTSLCELSTDEINQLKEKYPLIIELGSISDEVTRNYEFEKMVNEHEETESIEFTEIDAYQIVNNHINYLKEQDSIIYLNKRILKSPIISDLEPFENIPLIIQDSDLFPVFIKEYWNTNKITSANIIESKEYNSYFKNNYTDSLKQIWNSKFEKKYIHNISFPVYDNKTKTAIIKVFPYKPYLLCVSGLSNSYYYKKTDRGWVKSN